jgi:drug/metabolite transporter (DMT)-like permease
MSARGWLLFATLGIVWGLPYLLIKMSVAELPVAVLVFGRVAVGAAVLLPFALRAFPAATLWQHRGPLLAFAVLEFALPWGLLSHAEKSIDSATAGLLMATIPAITVILGRLTGDTERLAWRRTAGLALGFAGVAVLAGPAWRGDGLAIVEVLIAASAYAAAAVVAGRRLQQVPALPMTAACLAIAAIIYLPAAAATWPAAWPSTRTLLAMSLLSVVCTALAFVWFFGLLREVGVHRAVVVTYVNPAVAVAAGAAVLSEPITGLTVVAFMLILAGSFLATLSGDNWR